MRKTFIAAAFVVALSFSGTISAQKFKEEPRQKPLTVLGAGAFTCAEFAEQYRGSTASTETFYTSWLLGFLVGLNATASADGTPTRDYSSIDINHAQAFVRNYCNTHPLSMYARAAREYADTVPLLP